MADRETEELTMLKVVERLLKGYRAKYWDLVPHKKEYISLVEKLIKAEQEEEELDEAMKTLIQKSRTILQEITMDEKNLENREKRLGLFITHMLPMLRYSLTHNQPSPEIERMLKRIYPVLETNLETEKELRHLEDDLRKLLKEIEKLE